MMNETIHQNDNDNDTSEQDQEQMNSNNNTKMIQELNIAYETLESMRMVQLEMTCQELYIPYTKQDIETTCTKCLLERRPPTNIMSNNNNQNNNNNNQSIIIIKALQAVSSQMVIEHFLETELLVNITKHQLVPKHVVLTNEEKEALLTR